MSREVQEYPIAELHNGIETGEIAPYTPEDLPKYVDCGDKRPLTAECEAKRTDISARYFGSACGLALVAANAYGMQSDRPYRDVRDLIAEHEEGVIGIAAEISGIAFKELGVRVYLHSADNVEEHPRSIKDDCDQDVGCALMAKSGMVIANAGNQTTEETAHEVAEFEQTDVKDDVNSAINNTRALLPAIGGEDSKIRRESLLSILRDKRRKTPLAILKGHTHITDETSVNLDLSGYKVAADGKNYVHSVPLAEHILPVVLPGLKLDKRALRASSLVLGVATWQTLGVKRLNTIPAGRQ